MADNPRSGKLAVILHADIVSSSALVQQDERLAHDRIQETFHRFGDIINQYHGRVRELRGDALLAEFQRASDAVTAALALQSDQSKYNAQLEDDIRPTVRVGIAMGEVIIADNTVTGASVVLAQRVEQLAEPGCCCITAAIHEALPQRMPFDQENFGERQVKGFDEQIRVYTVCLSPGATIPEPATLTQTETAVLNLPDQPSIAVLPFANMSGDPEQEYFSDGITEDIITELSRFGEYHVVSRNSVLVYKNKPVKAQDVGRNLKVRYVLEGSVRRAGNRVRIVAQLIDTTTGHHVWAERYDRELEDIFAVQDEVTQKIVATLAGRLEATERQRIRTDRTKNLHAYDCLLRGREIWYRFTPEANRKARHFYEKAIELDPNYVRAYTSLCWTHIVDYREAWVDSPEKALNDALEIAKSGIEVNPTSHSAYLVLGHAQLLQATHEDSIETFEKAIAINPNDADSYVFLARAFIYAGRSEEAINLTKTAMELNPNYPNWYRWTNGVAYFITQQYAEAISILRKIHSPEDRVCRWLAASYGQAGYENEAKAVAEVYLQHNPHFSFAHHSETEPFKNADDLERYLSGLRKAGFPE